jgi:hypothetical protein
MGARRFILALSLLLSLPLFGSNDLGLLLKELDQTLERVEEYDRQKEERLARLKQQLSRPAPADARHETYHQLFKEYEPYVFDSAIYYVQEHLDLSLRENNRFWINECKMQLARMYSTFARFPEAINLLNSIDINELNVHQLGAYYNSFAEVYIYWGEYNTNDDRITYASLKDTYQDSALLVLPRNTYEFDINNGRKNMETRRYEEAELSLLPYLEDMEKDTRDYAILTSLVAHLYEQKGDVQRQKEYLALSAIADLKASVKENTSLGKLSLLLLDDGDVTRANNYVKKSLEDANFYNARLRNVQISRILPIIDRAYQMEREKHQSNLQLSILIIGILSLFLVAVIFYLNRQMTKLARTRKDVVSANEELKKVNNYLSETNHIKEEYIGRFLNQCSIYIDKLESYRKSLNKKAAAGQMDDLYRMLKSHEVIENELKEFYQNFDSTFLNLFPDFVTEFNDLLPPEDRITPKYENSLTIELRIFALIRLGITDSAKIAGFLRYSITTIYNYRSKYRNRALVPRERFEETVMKIGADS